MTSFRDRTLPILVASTLVSSPALGEDEDISDNGFFVEEAYNQDRGVVQHIQTMELANGREWAYSFTDEWPSPDREHQLSITVPVLHADGDTGLGDVSLGYGRELFQGHDDILVVTPRLSVWLPSGDADRGRGTGAAGLSLNGCVSVRANDWLVLHSNLGVSAPLSSPPASQMMPVGPSFVVAQSAIWLALPKLNFLAEAVANLPDQEVVLSPGLRAAIDVSSSLQIVPGLAVPLTVENGEHDWGLYFYLSVEHALPSTTKEN